MRFFVSGGCLVKKADHPLKGYYLTRLYHAGSDPFDVVTDLIREEALEICSRFAPNRRVRGLKGDHGAYLEGRLETEDWLRENARTAGVQMSREHPVYFTITKEPQNGKAPPGKEIISIPAEMLDLRYCSFTYGDSMNRTSEPPENPHPLEGTVLNAAQVAAAVKKIGITGDYLDGGRYFEAQMWTRPQHMAQQRPAKPSRKPAGTPTP